MMEDVTKFPECRIEASSDPPQKKLTIKETPLFANGTVSAEHLLAEETCFVFSEIQTA